MNATLTDAGVVILALAAAKAVARHTSGSKTGVTGPQGRTGTLGVSH